jgi:hypothetical protein
MLKFQEIADARSCLNHAENEEPVFVLRANDENAPDSIRHWVHLYVFSKGGYLRMNATQRAKADEAYAVARQMEDWRKIKRATK